MPGKTATHSVKFLTLTNVNPNVVDKLKTDLDGFASAPGTSDSGTVRYGEGKTTVYLVLFEE